jgi:malonyl-CoA/methylmalonyl-CoA synthetase
VRSGRLRPVNANLYAELAVGVESAPDRSFLSVPGHAPRTYRDLHERSARMAAVLGDHGVEPGDRVIVQIDKSVDNVALYLGCVRRGGVYVPLNTAYTPDEVAYFVSDAEPALVVAVPGAAVETNAPVLTLAVDGSGSLAEAADATDPARTIDRVVDRSPGDLAAMIYTSGTTGRSKGAMLTHENLTSNALALHRLWAFEPGDVLLHILPLFHVHGLMVALHTAMLNASEVLFLPRFDVDQVIELLPRATVMMGVPTHYGRLLADPRFDSELTARMRLFTSGSAPMTELVHEEFTARTGHAILERYGMSEAGMITSNPYVGDRVPGTVGFALPGVEIRVCDEEGAEAPVGEAGIVEVRGPNVFAGYWRQPDKTSAEMRTDGFFRTGDIGRLDEDGRLTLEGRAGDMIISGGFNVYPREIELCLDECEGVHESAVVGLPHPDLGEAVTAFVVPETGSIETVALAAALEGVARFKHPKRYVEIDALPRNSMGKVQKSVLRESNADLYS